MNATTATWSSIASIKAPPFTKLPYHHNNTDKVHGADQKESEQHTSMKLNTAMVKIKKPQVYLVREFTGNRDVVILPKGAKCNLLKVDRVFAADGTHTDTTTYLIPGSLPLAIRAMGNNERMLFFKQKQFEIVVRLDKLPVVENFEDIKEEEAHGLAKALELFGQDFPAITRKLVITVHIPHTASVGTLVSDDFKMVKRSAAFRVMEGLAELLEKFTGLRTLDVVIRTLSESPKKNHLEYRDSAYVIPLCALSFTHWKVFYQSPNMGAPAFAHRSHGLVLNREYAKLIKEKLAKEKVASLQNDVVKGKN